MKASTIRGMYTPCLKKKKKTDQSPNVNSLTLVNTAMIPKGKQEERRRAVYRFNRPLYHIKSSQGA